ncbi:NifU family protein [Sulfurimonas sp. SAG-AH-194-I05]|nr:NifU family protein [Sulfurimonas sp. SAG-AH-194-I05]MDF1874384.1 NifU family protein [Sulfurimonas sp. SAG-AH-194-I05]
MNEHEDFANMTLVQKINKIDKVIDDNIREFLVRDNGDMDLVNVTEKNGLLLVYIEFQGACTSCASAGGTESSIENILQRMLSSDIRVISI